MGLSKKCLIHYSKSQSRQKAILLGGFAASILIHAAIISLVNSLVPDERQEFAITSVELINIDAVDMRGDSEASIALDAKANDQSRTPRAEKPEPIIPRDSNHNVSHDSTKLVQKNKQPLTPVAPNVTAQTPIQEQTDQPLISRKVSASKSTPQESTRSSSVTGSPLSSTTKSGSGSSSAARKGAKSNSQVATRSAVRQVVCVVCAKPNYPRKALASGIEGQPVVMVSIGSSGRVEGVSMRRSSGNKAIDQAALTAARRSRFKPVPGGARIPIQYELTIKGSQRHKESSRQGERKSLQLR
ncbi:MAG: energy transducer TonB [Prochlorococcus sp.]